MVRPLLASRRGRDLSEPSGSSAPEAVRLRLEDARSIAIVNIHTVEKETEQNVTWYRNDPGAYQDG